MTDEQFEYYTTRFAKYLCIFTILYMLAQGLRWWLFL